MAARSAGTFLGFLLLAAGIARAGYGDAVDGRPSMAERDMTVATNMVRADPQGFRDAYIGVDTILLAENFPATHPLYHYGSLDEVARLHAEDMAANHGMSHTSSDGTPFNVRVPAYYDNWNYIGENVATGVSTGLGTVIQLLRDDIYPTDHPASDSSADDGHRRNIMSPNFTETGAGYAFGADIRWYHFWCQDLGRRFSAAAGTRIPSGSHFNPDAGTVSFMANYYDEDGSAPQSVSVVVDNTPHAMALHLGTPANGTWTHGIADSGYRMRYWFTCTDASGGVTRYPATDTLYVNPDADDPPSTVTGHNSADIPVPRITVCPFPATAISTITCGDPSAILQVYDCTGTLVRSAAARNAANGFFNGLTPGIYQLSIMDANSADIISLPIVR